MHYDDFSDSDATRSEVGRTAQFISAFLSLHVPLHKKHFTERKILQHFPHLPWQ